MRIKATVAVSLVLAASAIGACGGSSGISSKFHRDYVAGCARTQSKDACECLYSQLTEKQGFSTEQKLKDLSDRVVAAARKGDRSAFPEEFVNSVNACKSKIRPTGG
jgi:hypothetical protein